jgi:ABC-type polar amino acid transport system ATPase subunit
MIKKICYIYNNEMDCSIRFQPEDISGQRRLQVLNSEIVVATGFLQRSIVSMIEMNLSKLLWVIESSCAVTTSLKNEAEERAFSMSKMLNIPHDLICKYPPELSRGQRQRVAIARTLLMEPEIILLDEASASLDEGLTKQLAEIIQVLKSQGRTILTITHDRHFAADIGDRVIEFAELLESATK